MKPFESFEDWWRREGLHFHFIIEKEKLERVWNLGYSCGFSEMSDIKVVRLR